MIFFKQNYNLFKNLSNVLHSVLLERYLLPKTTRKNYQSEWKHFHFTSNPRETWASCERSNYTLRIRNTDALSSAHGVRTRGGWACLSLLLPLAERKEAPPCAHSHWLPRRTALRPFILPMLQPRESMVKRTQKLHESRGRMAHTHKRFRNKGNTFAGVKPDEPNLTRVSKYCDAQCRSYDFTT